MIYEYIVVNPSGEYLYVEYKHSVGYSYAEYNDDSITLTYVQWSRRIGGAEEHEHGLPLLPSSSNIYSRAGSAAWCGVHSCS